MNECKPLPYGAEDQETATVALAVPFTAADVGTLAGAYAGPLRAQLEQLQDTFLN